MLEKYRFWTKRHTIDLLKLQLSFVRSGMHYICPIVRIYNLHLSGPKHLVVFLTKDIAQFRHFNATARV
jgi:hypothetical protein